jgi:parallel beta-helix repeat protein
VHCLTAQWIFQTGTLGQFEAAPPANDYCLGRHLAAQNNVIANNRIDNSTTGIFLIGTSAGNQITANVVTTSTRNGIVLAGNVSANTISGTRSGRAPTPARPSN